MPFVSKNRKLINSKLDSAKLFSLPDAVKLVKELAFSKMDESVDVAVNLGVDPRHADQNVRGAVLLPHGLGKVTRIVVFAKGEKAVEANGLGVEAVGGDDLAKRISDGWLDFDQVVATPDMMGVVGRLGKVLGPRGLMPNPKLGTVTFNISETVAELRAGRAEFRCDKAGIIHASIGRVKFDSKHLEENISCLMDALNKIKPAVSKGTYIKKVTISSTMGPGVKVGAEAFRL